MNKIIRVTKLDFMVMKSFWKYLAWYLVFPLFFLFGMKSLVSGMAMAMGMLSMSALLIFQNEESTGGAEFYSFLPVSRRQRILGRYLTALSIGLAGLVCSLILQTLILTAMGVGLTVADYGAAVMGGMGIFFIMTAMEFPILYRFGAVKSRIVSLIPLVLVFVSVFALGNLFPDLFREMSGKGVLVSGILIVVGLLCDCGSALLSVRIAGRKR